MQARLSLWPDGRLVVVEDAPGSLDLNIFFDKWAFTKPVRKDSLSVEVTYMSEECDIEKFQFRASSEIEALAWLRTLIAFRKSSVQLEAALQCGSLETLMDVIEKSPKGIDILKVRFADGLHATHLAAQVSKIEVLHWLLQKNQLWKHMVARNGQQPLHCAVLARNVEAVKLLLKVGAQFQLDSTNASPLELLAGLHTLRQPPMHVAVDDIALAESISLAVPFAVDNGTPAHPVAFQYPALWRRGCIKKHGFRSELDIVFTCSPPAAARECGMLRLSLFVESWPLKDLDPSLQAYAGLYKQAIKKVKGTVIHECTESVLDGGERCVDICYSSPLDRGVFGTVVDMKLSIMGAQPPSRIPGLWDEKPMTRMVSRIVVNSVVESCTDGIPAVYVFRFECLESDWPHRKPLSSRCLSTLHLH
ncbi:hypothetical protein CBR_g45289 [Chara braunii]|uniref:Uncharacterized protein n=1 Tax=Chara braunii TaxID=69332 RepID=A0A388LY24_CHABU|nr:hypothetical protein CBR_g45289 [Chara braunii]|eukprot:GBG87230.1 hypothetical protein CBR_g45289 [Chara braunii]